MDSTRKHSYNCTISNWNRTEPESNTALILRDDRLNYTCLFPFRDTPAENAERGLLNRCAAFSVPGGLRSECSTNFRYETAPLIMKARVPISYRKRWPICIIFLLKFPQENAEMARATLERGNAAIFTAGDFAHRL